MKEPVKQFLSYALPIVICFFLVGLLNIELFTSPAFYLTILIYMLVINIMTLIFAKIENGTIHTLPQFFAVMIFIAFLTIAMFAAVYQNFSDSGSYLVSQDGRLVTKPSDTFHFSGTNFLSIGYGYIIPMGTFKMISIFEDMLGMVVLLTFIALGASAIYEKERRKYVEHMEKLEKVSIVSNLKKALKRSS